MSCRRNTEVAVAKIRKRKAMPGLLHILNNTFNTINILQQSLVWVQTLQLETLSHTILFQILQRGQGIKINLTCCTLHTYNCLRSSIRFSWLSSQLICNERKRQHKYLCCVPINLSILNSQIKYSKIDNSKNRRKWR